MVVLNFLIDENLGLHPDELPWSELFPALGIAPTTTTDLAALDRSVAEHQPDIVFLPVADFHGVLASGDDHYRGLAAVTSKFTGSPNLPSVLVVRKGDSATCLADLAGATLGYINRSCTSSYFAPAILVHGLGQSLGEYFELRLTRPWQGQIDAVASGEVRATMVLDDVWRSVPANSESTKVIGRYEKATGALVVVRNDLDANVARRLLDALISWEPKPAAIFGRFKAFAEADVEDFFADLDLLPTAFHEPEG